MDQNSKNLPESIQLKLSNVEFEVNKIIEEARGVLKSNLTGSVSFRYQQSAPMDILTAFERAQSVCFVSRYEILPIFNGVEILESNGKFFLNNITFIRYILNEYRSVISNYKDSVYYGKIHKFCFDKLKNRDPKTGLSITVNNEQNEDVTDIFIKILGERNRSIKIVLEKSEFGYIYNGILQHSDHEYTERYWKEYHTGQLNYVFIKHAALLVYIKECLFWHYTILNQLTFPKLGPLG
jgi:hypothetical protein